ncbi:MAG: hypothetical protein ACREJ3_12850 [Polyangiaceae bacterium]
MSIDAMVLRAMLRLARRRQPANQEAISLRVGSDPCLVQESIRRLAEQGLLDLRGGERWMRLTMPGFALALALLPGQGPASARRAPNDSPRTSRAA